MNKLIRLSDYSPTQNDKLFFDTNIWLALFVPTGNYINPFKLKEINKFYGSVLKIKSSIYTSNLVLSEFFNSYSRILFNQKKSEDPDKFQDYKKDFRNTDEYKQIAKEITEIINGEIVSASTKLDDGFTNIDLDYILCSNDEDTFDYYDYNDRYISALCCTNEIKIVTADKDFIKSPTKTDIIYLP